MKLPVPGSGDPSGRMRLDRHNRHDKPRSRHPRRTPSGTLGARYPGRAGRSALAWQPVADESRHVVLGSGAYRTRPAPSL